MPIENAFRVVNFSSGLTIGFVFRQSPVAASGTQNWGGENNNEKKTHTHKHTPGSKQTIECTAHTHAEQTQMNCMAVFFILLDFWFVFGFVAIFNEIFFSVDFPSKRTSVTQCLCVTSSGGGDGSGSQFSTTMYNFMACVYALIHSSVVGRG